MSVSEPKPSKSIRKVAKAMRKYVLDKNVFCLSQVDAVTSIGWQDTCDHELFHQDADRYLGDLNTYFTHTGELNTRLGLYF